MPERDAAVEIASVIENQDVAVTRAASELLAPKLGDAARELQREPERMDEARENIARFVNHARGLSKRPGNEIDEKAVEQALLDLCPIWPIC